MYISLSLYIYIYIYVLLPFSSSKLVYGVSTNSYNSDNNNTNHSIYHSSNISHNNSNNDSNRGKASAKVGEGQMGSALMGSLHISFLFTEGLFGNSR